MNPNFVFIQVKHQKVKLFRANEPILSVLMWGKFDNMMRTSFSMSGKILLFLIITGINHTINELQSIKIPGLLLPDHFRANSKIKVDYHLYNK